MNLGKTEILNIVSYLISNILGILGVDLNRNYGFHYGESLEDADECSETYRGPTAFSESETRAIRELVERESRISSAMNFHAYGNIWIHPFNYLKDRNGYPENLDPSIINFYERFKTEVGLISTAKIGNVQATVGYTADGEGSDWMLGEHQIIAFSPELGLTDSRTDKFFFPKDLINQAIEENYKVIEIFLQMNVFNLKSTRFGFDNKSNLFILFQNDGLAELYDAIIDIETENMNLFEEVTSIDVEVRQGEVFTPAFQRIDENKADFRMVIPKMHKLSSNRISLNFKNAKIRKAGVNFAFILKQSNGNLIGKVQILIEPEFDPKNVVGIFTTLYVSLIVASTLVIVQKLHHKSLDSQNPILA